MRATEIARKVNSGELSAQKVITETLALIKEKNPSLNAFLEIFETTALTRAKEIDTLPVNKRGKLAGVPIAIKDNICTKGQKKAVLLEESLSVQAEVALCCCMCLKINRVTLKKSCPNCSIYRFVLNLAEQRLFIRINNFQYFSRFNCD